MIDPDYYLFADLSITEIEGPAEFYDWETEEEIINHMYDWETFIIRSEEHSKNSTPADELGDELVKLEDSNDLMSW